MYFFLAMLAFCMFAPSAAVADPLLGDVAAAYTELSAVEENPANAAFLDRTQISIAPEVFKTETVYARYPGFESASLAESGLGNPLSKPAFIYKPNSRLAIGGYAIPPLPFEVDIKKQRLPVMLLGTLNYIDLFAKGRLNGAGQALVGYRVTSSLGIGINANFQSVGFDAELIPSDGGEKLATITGAITTINSNLGVRYEATSSLAIGLSFGLFSQNNQDLKIESSLLEGQDTGDKPNTGSGGGSVTNPADSFLIGFDANFSKMRMLLDLKYQRANPEQETFSLVDLKNKKKDVYDTLAVRSGMSLALSPTNSALLGFRYEPSGLGPGSPGEDGKAGFGTIDLVTMFAGFDTLKPYTQYSVGLRMLAGWVSERSSKRKSNENRGYHAWALSFGLVHRIASLGIDENGELPGAYLQKKTFIPVTIVRKF